MAAPNTAPVGNGGAPNAPSNGSLPISKGRRYQHRKMKRSREKTKHFKSHARESTGREHGAREPASREIKIENSDTADEARQPQGEADRLCGLCRGAEGKYKCSRCLIRFCSLQCNKKHQANHPTEDAAPSKRAPTAVFDQEAADEASRDENSRFSALASSDLLSKLFIKYPYLPEQLLAINKAMHPPPNWIPALNNRPVFNKPTAPSERSHWDPDVGLFKGMEALGKAMDAEGEEGEGMREYAELLSHVLWSRPHGTN